MYSSKLKSALQMQKIKNDFGYVNVSRAIARYQRNLLLIRGCGDSAESSFKIILGLNFLLITLSVLLSFLSSSIFPKDLIISTLIQFNIVLPLLVCIPLGLFILKSLCLKDEKDNGVGFYIMGNIVGTFTILTFVPLVSIIAEYILNMFLI